MSPHPPNWKQLAAAAREEVEAILAALPGPLAGEAAKVPVAYVPRPTPDMISADLPPDTLGLFVGEAFPETYAGVQDIPAEVLLFIENIWDYAGQDLETYREEVRRTFLHELGHYLGLDEDALIDRDLD